MNVDVSPSGDRLAYRSEIDGLRAIAVLGVLIFHINASWLPAGFVGVDVFFVISGYVVCRSIMNYPAQQFWANLARFYQRRIRRLLPALFLMLWVVALLRALLVPAFPDELHQYVTRYALLSLVGLSNLYAVRAQHQYFDGNAVDNPFLHTWSLAVEEQFYLVLPLLFFLIRRRDLFIWVLLGMLLASVAFSMWVSKSFPVSAYYTMPSRFWELAVGCVIALTERRFGLLSRSAAWSGQFAGLLLLALALWWSPKTNFPFPNAVPAVLGTALLIWANGPSVIYRLLQTRVSSYVGKISYSLYLWHFPVIYFVSLCYGLDLFGAAAAFLLSFLCAACSYHYVEQRFSAHAVNSGKGRETVRTYRSSVAAGFGVVAVAGSIFLFARFADQLYLGKRQDWSGHWQAPAQAERFAGQITAERCHLNTTQFLPIDPNGVCLAQAADRDLGTMFVVGDSHAYASWPMISAGVAENRYHMLGYSMDGCALADAGKTDTPCGQYWQAVQNYVRTKLDAGDALYLAVFLRNNTFGLATEKALEELLDAARQRGAKVILEAPLPLHQAQAISCLPAWFKRNSPHCLTSRAAEAQANLPIKTLFETMAVRDPNVRVWDPTPWLCPDAYCQHFLDGLPIYRDDDHLSYYGSSRLARQFLRFLDSSSPRAH